MNWTSLMLLVVLVSCTSKPQITCYDEEGNISYIGPYDEERRGAYIVHLGGADAEVYHLRRWCHK